MKAQEYFIQSLNNVIVRLDLSDTYLETKPNLHIKSNYINNTYYESSVSLALSSILKTLNSTYDFSNQKLPVDCCLINHPYLKTRIIEFDEAQHFSQKRLIAINELNACVPLHFHDEYISLLNNPDVTKAYEKTIRNRSGFSSPKKGFNYDGGRISQRAFYDTLKDIAHLSEENPTLSPIIRFSIFEFGTLDINSFLNIPQTKVEEYIEQKLKMLSLNYL